VIILTINTNTPLTDLITSFIKKGGKINKYYLQDISRNKPSLVYLKGWFRGKNIKEAITKALNP